MKKIFLLVSSCMVLLAITACSPRASYNPTPPSSATSAVQVPTTVSPSATEQSQSLQQYANSAFGLSFQYPSSWFGPDEYNSGQTLRVAVGSDKVYPYGELPATPSDVKNSYLVVVQYSKDSQDQSWKDTYSILTGMQDGESLSGTRSLLIRVRQLELGRFKGFEFISTLSATAQTDHVYSREAILVDEQSNLLSILGSPNNVEVANGADWREVYRMVDEANQAAFHAIVESMRIKAP